MTSDLVERLREHGDKFLIKNSAEWIDFASLYLVEAADEIERLRAALREIVAMDEVAIVDFKKGDGWLHQRVARTALAAPSGALEEKTP